MKKVLIITYYWPPAGGPGVQRWLKFVKYLREFDIEPIVYKPTNPDYPLVDNSLLNEVPGDITLLEQKIFEPYFLARFFSKKHTSAISSGIIPADSRQGFLQKVLLYIRGNFFIPDARRSWVKPSVKFLSDYITKHRIDTIITTGPPHSMHLIGLNLVKRNKLKWVADFRDPWTQIGYHKKLKLTDSSELKHQNLEQQVLDTATHIITTSFTTRDEFEKQTTTPITVITNGYDEQGKIVVDPDSKFTLAHIGSLLSGRDPKNLWQVLGELIRENSSFRNHFQLKLVGAVSEEVLASIHEEGLGKNLLVVGYVSHSEAVKIQRNSGVLLLIEINSKDTRGIIPGKFFEYMASKRPIIALGPEKWDVERILYETGSGNYFNYFQKEELKHRILAYYGLFLKDHLRSDSRNMEKYTRRNLTGKLAELLKKL